MKKIVLVIFSMLFGLSVSLASDKYIKFEDFVHFNQAQKIRTIELVHEFLIEYEKLALYQKYEHKKKYHTYLKILNYFIDSAYANNSSPFALENISGDIDLCYYAGWMSATITQNGQKYCQHPNALRQYISNVQGQTPPPSNLPIIREIQQKYRDNVTEGSFILEVGDDGLNLDLENVQICSLSNNILCNPSIYGRVDGKTICVAGNSQQGANSSLLCTQALNILKEEHPEKYSATMSGIVNQAISDNSNTRDEFFYTLRSMYDTCLCGNVNTAQSESGDPRNNDRYFLRSIDANYASKLFNQRTCFGIINQTQHIFEELRTKDFESPLCQRFLDTRVNGSTGLNWLSYLDKAYNVIQDQNINQTIQSITADISGERLTRRQAEELLRADRESFAQMRQGHFETYTEENLCPLGYEEFMPPPDDDDTERSLTIELVNTDANTDGEFAFVAVTYTENGEDKTIEQRENISLTSLGTTNTSTLEDQSTDENVQYKATRLENEYRVQAILEVDGETLTSNEVIIPARRAIELDDGSDDPAPEEDDEGRSLSISLSGNANDDGDFSLVLATYTENGEDKTDEKAESIQLAPTDSSVTGANITNQSAGSGAQFQVTRLDDDYTVKATLTIGEDTIESNELVIPKKESEEPEPEPEPTGAEQANCSVKLKLTPGSNGRLAISVEIKAPNDDGELTTYPDEDNQMPRGVSLTWYDSSQGSGSGASSSSPSTAASGNMIEEDEPESDDEEEASSRRGEQRAEIVTQIESNLPRSNRFNVGEDEQPYSTIAVAPTQNDRTVGVIMKIGETCEAGDAANIPGQRQEQAARPVNQSPMQLRRTPPRQTLPGMILNGVR